MKEISRRLAAEEYPLIDVTLKQFPLPWSNEWEGTKEGYVLHMIDDAPDQALMDLALHVGFQFEQAFQPRMERGGKELDRLSGRNRSVGAVFLNPFAVRCKGQFADCRLLGSSRARRVANKEVGKQWRLTRRCS
jgi:hypothetical protein